MHLSDGRTNFKEYKMQAARVKIKVVSRTVLKVYMKRAYKHSVKAKAESQSIIV